MPKKLTIRAPKNYIVLIENPIGGGRSPGRVGRGGGEVSRAGGAGGRGRGSGEFVGNVGGGG